MSETDEHSIAACFAVHIWEKYGTQIAAAQAYDVSPTMVNNVVKGRKMPTKAMLADMGLQRTVVYAKVGQQ